MDSIYVSKVNFGLFRGLQGSVRLTEGLNIILGRNNSGKTTLLEAIAAVFLANLSDVREDISKFLVQMASRGSERHALWSIVPEGIDMVRPCVVLERSYVQESNIYCTKIKNIIRYESAGIRIEPVVEVHLESEARECSIRFNLSKRGLSISAKGNCTKTTQLKEGMKSLGVITSGVLPYNLLDSLIGLLKRESPGEIENMFIRLGEEIYSIDLAADPWNEMVAITSVRINDERKAIPFYAIGRGLQRVFQMLTLAGLSDILLIDEIESAMHPNLLRELALRLAELSQDGIQIITTTQSLEAAVMLASATLDKKVVSTQDELLEKVEDACQKAKPRIGLIILETIDNKVKSLLYRGCDAIKHIATTIDPRLSYVLLHNPSSKR